MARIPFELNDEIKDAFVDRIMLYGKNSIVAARPSMSQVLRSVVSLVVTMDDTVLRNFLEMSGKAETLLSEYLDLFNEYSEKGLIPSDYPLINIEFEETYELLRSIKLNKISEEQFKEKIEILGFSLYRYKVLQKETHNLLNSFGSSKMFGSPPDLMQRIEKQTVAEFVMEETIKENIKK